MARTDLVELEATVNGLPGVLGCVILSTPDGDPAEIQAFSRQGSDRGAIERRILEEVDRLGLRATLREVFVFELDAEERLGDRGSLEDVVGEVERAAAPEQPSGDRGADARPSLVNVSLSSAGRSLEAHVALRDEDQQIVGRASGQRTPHGLGLLAQATLDAIARIAPDRRLGLVGASLVTTFEREAVLVVVEEGDAPETIGAALVRSGPVSEAAVRATLDAVNRRLGR